MPTIKLRGLPLEEETPSPFCRFCEYNVLESYEIRKHCEALEKEVSKMMQERSVLVEEALRLRGDPKEIIAGLLEHRSFGTELLNATQEARMNAESRCRQLEEVLKAHNISYKIKEPVKLILHGNEVEIVEETDGNSAR